MRMYASAMHILNEKQLEGKKTMVQLNNHNPPDPLYKIRKDGFMPTIYSELNQDELKALHAFNKTLMLLEKGIKAEAQRLYDYATARIVDSNDWLDRYRLDVELTFFLRKDDPYYVEEYENTLALFTSSFQNEEDFKFGLDDNSNHNDIQASTPKEEQDFHCWIFHNLFSPRGLYWNEIIHVDIENIRVEFNLDLQHVHNGYKEEKDEI